MFPLSTERMVTVTDRIAASDSLPAGARPARFPPLAATGWSVATRSLGRLAIGRLRQRGADRVQAEYDGGNWASILEKRSWTRCGSLDEYLIGNDRQAILARIDGKPYEISRCEYYRWRMQLLQSVVRSYVEDDGTLIELGCGYGYNVFSLALGGNIKTLRGYDISENGIAAARAIASHFGVEHVSFDLIDLTDPTHSSFGEIAGKTVLTYFCFEQLPHDLGRVIRNIVEARPRRVISIEAATGARRPTNLLDLLNDLYVRSQDYQTGLAGCLRGFQTNNSLKLLEQTRLGYGPTIHNEAFLFVWEPTPPR